MHKTEPKIFLLGETRINEKGLQDYLNHLGVGDWVSDAGSDAEKMVEVYGRLCYKSFKPGLNKNVTKVREHNKDFLLNLLNQTHGSVLEHASVNFIFADVSRVFTHELVRHRVGVAISQESLRYVRLTDLGQWLPTCIAEDEKAVTIFSHTFEELERIQLQLAEYFRLDDEGVPFAKKKEITSAMRRIAPIGLATNIGWSTNHRNMRTVLEQRTNPGAEEEIAIVFTQVARLMMERYPNIYGDAVLEPYAPSRSQFIPKNRKV